MAADRDVVRLSFKVKTAAKHYTKRIQLLNDHANALHSSMTSSGLDQSKLIDTSFNLDIKTKYTEEHYTLALGKGWSHQRRRHP